MIKKRLHNHICKMTTNTDSTGTYTNSQNRLFPEYEPFG